MKTKILKKLIASLCAATMSTAVVAPAEAVQYTGTAKLEQNQIKTLDSINSSIQESQNALQKIKKHYMENKELDNDKKVKYVSLISSIEDNLTKLNNQNVSDKSFLTDMLLPRLQQIISALIRHMKEDVIDGKDDCVKSYAEKINSEIELLLKGNDEKNQVSKLKKAVDDKNTEMMKLIESVKKLDPSFKGNLYTDEAHHSFNRLKLIDNNKFETQLNTAIDDLNIAISHLKELNNKLQNRPSEDLKIKFNNKKKEFEQKLYDTRVIANHRRCNKNKSLLNINNTFINDWCKLINAKISKKNLISDWNKSDLSELSTKDIQERIKLIDDTIESLNKFALKISFPVFSNDLSYLRKIYSDQRTEISRLIERAKKQNPSFNAKDIGVLNEYFKLNIDLTNKTDVIKAISKMNNAIEFLEQFDDGEEAEWQKWQEQAHKEIDELLNQATKEMENSPNKTTVDALKKEFQPLLCGKQTMGNCWLYAICNVQNILNHFKNKYKGIVKNVNYLPLVNSYNNVECFFIQNGLPIEDVSEGGSLSKELKVLSKLGINHTSAEIDIENMDEESLKKNMNIVKTLLLKHFANSKAPVLINVKYDKGPFDCNNSIISNHAMVIVGLDIRTNSVVVADSNSKELQEYSLDRIALAICNEGITDFSKKTISMIFSLFNNKSDFHYDNNKNSWDEFKSKLLPAISK